MTLGADFPKAEGHWQCQPRRCCETLFASIYEMEIRRKYVFRQREASMRIWKVARTEVSTVPIYEFYCANCHAIYSFFSRRINTDKRPDCPKCGRPKLERRVSRFAIGRGGQSEKKSGEGGEDDDDLLPPGFDEEKFEEAMMDLAAEAENMNEEDPRQMASLMRRLPQKTGLEFGGAMEEALRRLEAGEDPETIEEELGDLLEQEEPIFQQSGKSFKGIVQHLKPPRVDEKLYDLD